MKLLTAAPLIALASAVLAQPKSEWKFSGYLDGYFQYDCGRPAVGNNLNGRGFDIAHNRARIAVGQLDALLAPTEKRPWGLNIQLYAGKNADLIHLAEPGGKDKYKFIRQAFITYAAPKFTVDFGKFDTWIGYEGVDNRTSDQYGRTFNWTYSEPTYETGLRVSGKLNEKLSGTFFLVRGWNEVEDGNGSPSIGVAFTYFADAKTSITIQDHYGDEGSNTANDIGTFGGIGFPNPGTSKVHLVDLIISHQLTPSTKIAFNVDYATSTNGANTGKWNGEVIYLRHQISEKRVAGLRLERVEDKKGLRVGMPIQLHSLTANFDVSVHKHATLRLEVRRDMASQAFFNRDSGLSKERTTLTAAAILKL